MTERPSDDSNLDFDLDATVGECPDDLAAALRHAYANPTEEEAWDTVEELVDEHQLPEPAAKVFRAALGTDLDAEDRMELAQRAQGFFDEWFEESQLVELLTFVVRKVPEDETAFERLSMLLTVAERWTDLLSLYDELLERATDDPVRYEALLEEAAQIAKDFAGDPDRAIHYLQKQFERKKKSSKLAANLERLFERQARWDDLIGLWEQRLEVIAPENVPQTRVRIAKCQLEKRGDAQASLTALEPLTSAEMAFDLTAPVLEAIVDSDKAGADVRRAGLNTLRGHYDQAERPQDVIRILRVALGFEEGPELAKIHAEVAERLEAAGDFGGALGHVGELLILAPADGELLEKLRGLAGQADGHLAFSEALVKAAENAEPAVALERLEEAARTYAETLGNADRAIELYQQVRASEACGDEQKLRVARLLAELLAAAERKSDLVEVWELLAGLAPDNGEKLDFWGRAARLADELGNADRALAAWRKRRELDESDSLSLDEIVRLLEREGRHEQLIEALNSRAALLGEGEKRREDQERIAGIYADKLENVPAAIETWKKIRDDHGEDETIVDTLGDLLARNQDWSELCELLRRVAEDEGASAERRSNLLARLGETQRLHLEAPQNAAENYAKALKAAPSNASAREGLWALLEVEGCRADAAQTLADAYEATGEWAETLRLLEPRLATLDDNAVKALTLLEAAQLYEERAEDVSAALDAVGRAMPLAPTDESVEAEVQRLAKATGEWEKAVVAFRGAIDILGDEGGERVGHLAFEEGKLYEGPLGNGEKALDSYSAAYSVQRSDLATVLAVVRVAGRLGRWEVAAAALCKASEQPEEFRGEVAAIFTAIAAESAGWDVACGAFETAIGDHSELSAPLLRELEGRLAEFHEQQRGDAAAAEAALLRGVGHEPSHRPTLERLAHLQRRSPGEALVKTLLQLAAAQTGDLNSLHEAAEVAVNSSLSPERQREILLQLRDAAVGYWRGEPGAEGSRSPKESAAWAVEQLYTNLQGAGSTGDALELLTAAAGYPSEQAERHAYLHRAAELAAGPLETPERAVELYRQVLAEEPTDVPAMRRLAELFSASGDRPSLLALHKHELGLDPEAERKLVLRLDIAGLLGEGENPEERLEERIAALEANLAQEAGHAASLEAITSVLEGAERHAHLADLVQGQAAALEEAERGAEAAKLWRQVAALAETPLEDIPRAISAHEKVVGQGFSADSLDQLARLHVAREEFERAVRWLEQRHEQASPEELPEVVVRLAQAYLGAERPADAQRCLEAALEAAPLEWAVRELLATRYREQGDWAPLVALLLAGAEVSGDEQKRALGYLGEAAQVQQFELDDAAAAIGTLQRAIDLNAKDRALRIRLADAMRCADQLDEAETLLNGLVEEFGRKRPPARAQVHFQLAQVAEARGQRADALKQLDTASKLDISNANILQMLGRIARASGELDRAERAYRGLLLVVRRKPSKRKAQAASNITASETLFQLYTLAKERDDQERAEEVLETAFETAAQGGREAERLEEVLQAAGEQDLLLRSLESRLERAEDNEARGSVLMRLAQVYAKLGRAQDALNTQLGALDYAPDSEELHASAAALAAEQGQAERYRETLGKLRSAAKQSNNEPLWAKLTLRLGDGHAAQDEGAADAALLYQEVAEAGLAGASVYRRLEDAHRKLDDHEGVRAALQGLVECDELDDEARLATLLKLAGLELARDEWVDEGVETMGRALEVPGADTREICGQLAVAAEAQSGSQRLLSLYEDVARRCDDEAIRLATLLLTTKSAETSQEQLREAVELAARTERDEDRVLLLKRAVSTAELAEDPAGAVWAQLALSSHYRGLEQWPQALTALQAAADASDPGESFELLLDVAAIAREQVGDLALASATYERLLEQDASERKVWEPLLGVYRSLGEKEKLEALVGRTIETVYDPDERNQLRMERARLLLDAGRQDDAISALQEVLDDDPGHGPSAEILMGIFREQGRDQDLRDLLDRQLDVARDGENAERVVEISLQLGQLAAKQNVDDAKDVYRGALDWAPESAAVLSALLALYGPDDDAHERADLTEQLLKATEGEGAEAIAIKLSEQRRELDDPVGAERALALGFGQYPQSEILRSQLEDLYTQTENYPALAAHMVVDAQGRDQAGEKVSRLRRAAEIYLTQVNDPQTAAETLEMAFEAEPQNIELLGELVGSLTASGREDLATEKVSAALEAAGEESPDRAALWSYRAKIAQSTGDFSAATEDLEQAYALSADAGLAALLEGLRLHRAAAEESGDGVTERKVTFRLVDLLGADPEGEGRQLLRHWSERTPDDGEAARRLLDAEGAAGNWEGVLAACTNLFHTETGESRVAIALKLAEACKELGRPEDARGALETLYQENPADPQIRAGLRGLYSQLETKRELAELVLAEIEYADDDNKRFELLKEAGGLWLTPEGHAPTAVNLLQQALEIKAGDHDCTLLLADAYTWTNQVGEASTLLEQAMAAHKGRRSRDLAALQHRMARVAFAVGDRNIELEWLSVALETDMQNGEVAAELADVATELGQLDIAIKALRAITLLKKPGPMSRAMAYLRQGMIAHHQGDVRKALFMAKKAKSEDPNLTEAEDFLASIS